MPQVTRGPVPDSETVVFLADLTSVFGFTAVSRWQRSTGRHVPGVPPWEVDIGSIASASPERAGRLTAPGNRPDSGTRWRQQDHGYPSGRGLCRRAPARQRHADG